MSYAGMRQKMEGKIDVCLSFSICGSMHGYNCMKERKGMSEGDGKIVQTNCVTLWNAICIQARRISV